MHILNRGSRSCCCHCVFGGLLYEGFRRKRQVMTFLSLKEYQTPVIASMEVAQSRGGSFPRSTGELTMAEIHIFLLNTPHPLLPRKIPDSFGRTSTLQTCIWSCRFLTFTWEDAVSFHYGHFQLRTHTQESRGSAAAVAYVWGAFCSCHTGACQKRDLAESTDRTLWWFRHINPKSQFLQQETQLSLKTVILLKPRDPNNILFSSWRGSRDGGKTSPRNPNQAVLPGLAAPKRGYPNLSWFWLFPWKKPDIMRRSGFPNLYPVQLWELFS